MNKCECGHAHGDHLDTVKECLALGCKCAGFVEAKSPPKHGPCKCGHLSGFHTPKTGCNICKCPGYMVGGTHDAVNHPSHYTFGKYEVIDVITDWGLDFSLGNAVKYIARAGKKGPALEDLKKARFYLNYQIGKLIEEAAAAEKPTILRYVDPAATMPPSQFLPSGQGQGQLDK